MSQLVLIQQSIFFPFVLDYRISFKNHSLMNSTQSRGEEHTLMETNCTGQVMRQSPSKTKGSVAFCWHLMPFLGVKKQWWKAWASLVVPVVKDLPADAGDIRDSGSIPGMPWRTIPSSILSWRIPCREPGGLWPRGSQRVRYDCSDSACTHAVKGIW